MDSFPSARWLTPVAVGTTCAVGVTLYGELSTGALVAVGVPGVALVAMGLVRRAGQALPPVGPRGLPWQVWLTAAGTWELLMLSDENHPTLSDLLDPILALPGVRGAAAVGWLLLGAWLITRPGPRHDSP